MDKDEKTNGRSVPWKEILAFLGVVLVAYIGYLGTRSQVEIPIQTTQTAESVFQTTETKISNTLATSTIVLTEQLSTPKVEPTSPFTPTPIICNLINSEQPFSVINNYDPSGYTGDLGDITTAKLANLVRFTYEPLGRPKHEWDYKYVDKSVNDQPAKFAGVMLLNPPSNWGTIPGGGFDLRGVRRIIRWEARSLNKEAYVEFLIGGVVWQWNNSTMEKEPAPYPDSMLRRSLGVRLLTEQWQKFEYDLSDFPEDNFKCVLGGFGWLITWGANEVAPGNTRIITIEVRNVYYEE